MINATSLILMLTAHILADFWLQPKIMVEKKVNKSILFHLIHSLICFALYFASLIFFNQLLFAFIAAISMALAHGIIDYSKSLLDAKLESSKWKIALFFIDQLLHITIIVVVSFFFIDLNSIGRELFIYQFDRLNISISYNTLLVYIFSILFLTQPVNVINRFVLDQNYGNNQNENEAKSGFIIGILERLTMYLFCALLNWYAILPVVLTAKTFARFDKLKNEKEFTEKYIVGTLLSTIFVGLCLVIGLFIK